MRIVRTALVSLVALNCAAAAIAQERVTTTVIDQIQPSTQCLQAQRNAEIRDGLIGGLLGMVAGHGLGKHGGRTSGTVLGAAAGTGAGAWVGAHSQICAQNAAREVVTTETVTTRQCQPVTERFVDPNGVSHSRTIEMCRGADGAWHT